MGFGPELWCPQGHSALLRMQESELRLLELLKKWMLQRSKGDREYATLLHTMFTQLEKQEGAGQLRPGDYTSPISEVGSAPAHAGPGLDARGCPGARDHWRAVHISPMSL